MTIRGAVWFPPSLRSPTHKRNPDSNRYLTYNMYTECVFRSYRQLLYFRTWLGAVTETF